MTENADQMPDENPLNLPDTIWLWKNAFHEILPYKNQGSKEYVRADLVRHQQPGAGMAVDCDKIKDTLNKEQARTGRYGNYRWTTDETIDHLAAQGLLKTPDADEYNSEMVSKIKASVPSDNPMTSDEFGEALREVAGGDAEMAEALKLTGFLASVIRCGEPYTSHVEDALTKIRCALTSQPDVRGMMEANGLSHDDLNALSAFLTKYPTWWWKIGVCDLTRDFDAAPQGHSPEAVYIRQGNDFDFGFQCDHSGTVADAINQVLEDVQRAIETFEDRE